MYRIFLSFAFLVFCSAAPYGGDFSSARSFPIRQEQQFIQQPQQQFVQQPQQPQFVQQPTSFFSGQQQQQQSDDTDIVDTLGAGYSYFRKQPVGSRPLVQQKLAMSEQQVPLTSLDDTSNQWNDYTKSSAFKQQPSQNQIFTASNDLLADGGYGQQSAPRTAMNIITTSLQDRFPQPLISQVRSSVSGGYGGQQEDLRIKTLGRPDQGAYGTALNLNQQQDMASIFQQQQPLQVIQPLIRTAGNSYGQQQQQSTQDFSTNFQQQPTQDFSTNFQQQPTQDFSTNFQQQQPLIRNLGSSYGQQQQQLDQPMFPVKTNSGYGQQAQPAFDNSIRQDNDGQQSQQTFVQPTFKALNTGYGQQQQQFDKPIITIKTNSGYGQQAQPAFGQQPQQTIVQPTFKALNTGYGQQQQQLDQPMFPVKTNSGYGQQQQLDQPTLGTISTGGYGQQQQLDQPMFPVKTNSGYGQQQQFDQPTLGTISTGGYGQQQQQLDQPMFPVKTNSGYGQQAQPWFADLNRQGNFGQQLQQTVLQPTLRTINSGYGQQQPAVQLSDNRPSNGY